jgi:DNA-binding transcriptional LysR family regulator
MRLKKFDLNLLVALDALLSERSVSRAAARLNLSPSATSDALGRLRTYFDDPLLVQVVKRMEPTARADQLKSAVHELLVQVDHTISAQPVFDPSTSDRQFRIYASDYTQFVLGHRLMSAAAAERCTAGFDFLPQVAEPQRDLERGDADLLILPSSLMSALHPQEPLYDETFVCAVWADSALARGTLTLERYMAAGHVLMRPQGAPRETSYEAWFMRQSGLQRRVAATSYGFATAAGLLVGTELIATMHASLARLLSQVWPLALRPCPVDVPVMTQSMQWHRARTLDPGLAWLRGLAHAAALQLTQEQAGRTP